MTQFFAINQNFYSEIEGIFGMSLIFQFWLFNKNPQISTTKPISHFTQENKTNGTKIRDVHIL